MPRRAPAILAAALAATALGTAGAEASAARVQSASCYDWSYNYAIDSSHIQVTAYWNCGGTAPQVWMVLQRETAPGSGSWQYVTDSYSPYPHNGITYTCVGTTPNTYQVGPIFGPGGTTNSFYQFTDNCG